ncbi:MAG: hypothetical protein ABI182_04175 [Candidatus Baltobacteraceae bacterium]
MGITANDLQPYLGKTLVIGLDHVDDDDKVVEQEQFWGTISGLDAEGWILIDLKGATRSKESNTLRLPPQLEAFQKADKEIYTLHTTGEQIENPDYVAVWNVAADALDHDHDRDH